MMYIMNKRTLLNASHQNKFTVKTEKLAIRSTSIYLKSNRTASNKND